MMKKDDEENMKKGQSADDDVSDLEKIYKHQEEELRSKRRNWMRSDKVKWGGAVMMVFGVMAFAYCFIAYAGAERNFPVHDFDLSSLLPCLSTGIVSFTIGLALYIFVRE